MRSHVAVIGAGVIGSSIAYQLSKRGAKVSIFDRGSAGQASQAAAGLLAPLSEASRPGAFLELGLESLRLHGPLAQELQERTGMDVGYRPSGLLRVALTAEEERALRHRLAWHEERVAGRWLDAERARDLEPALSREVRGAVYYAQEHHVSPPALVRALARAATDLGAQWHEGIDVEGLLIDRERVVGVRAAGERVRADEVVLAGGAWTASWSQTLKVELPIRPIRGQIVALRTARTALRRILYAADGYLVSKPDGLTYVGATEEDAGFDARPTAAGVAALLGLVPRVAPGLADATFSHAWAGLRPATPDRMPVLGRLRGWRGVVVASGHFRNGVLLAPITGELIADLIEHGKPRLPLDAFDPARFLVRAA